MPLIRSRCEAFCSSNVSAKLLDPKGKQRGRINGTENPPLLRADPVRRLRGTIIVRPCGNQQKNAESWVMSCGRETSITNNQTVRVPSRPTYYEIRTRLTPCRKSRVIH